MIPLKPLQLEQLAKLFHQGASEASRALSRWLERNVRVSLDSLDQAAFDEATESLGPADATLCACVMSVKGRFTGKLLFCFDDASGLLLCDLLLGRGTQSTQWGELEGSAAMETANIVGCSFLNAVSESMPDSETLDPNASGGSTRTCVPSPPQFVRDFAASIVEFAVMDQAESSDTILLARTKFQIDDTPVAWNLLLIPDALSLDSMSRVLG